MNPTTALPALSPRARIAGTLALVLLAYLGNILNLPMFFGVTFVFGSIMAMLAIVLFGTIPGLLVGIAGGLYTLVLFGHPYALVIFSLEALTVGLMYRKGIKNLVLIDLAYWLVLGAPLVLLFYIGVLGMDRTAAMLIALKQPLNGIFNALIASLFLLALQLYWRGAARLNLPPPRLPDILFHTVLTLILLAGTIPVVYQGYSHRAQEEIFLSGRMGNTVRQLARTFETQGYLDVSLQQALLDEAHTISGMGLALFDSNDQILAKSGKLASTNKPGNSQALNGELSIWLPSGNIPTMKRWKQGYYQYRLPAPGAATTLMAESSAAPLIQELEHDQLYLFGFLSALLLGGILSARLASRWLTQPLSALAKVSHSLTAQIAEGGYPVFPRNSIQEYDNLSTALRDMTTQLADNFHELHRIQASLQDQVQAQTAELKESERQLRYMLETSPIAARIARRGGREVVFSNARYTELIHAEPGGAAGVDPAAYYADPGDYADILNRLGRGERIADRLVELTIPGQGHKWTMASYLPIQYQGEAAVLGWFYDITELKQTEDALQTSSQQLTEAQRIAMIGSWSLRLTDNRLEWSDEIFRIFEIDPNRFEASYAAFVNAIHPDDREEVNKAYTDSVASHQPYHIVHRLLMPDGRIKYVEERCKTLYAEDGTPAASRGTVQDVTERKRVERMKDEFISTVSHELRTPLTSISGALGLINSGMLGQLPEQAAPMIDIAHKNSQRLSHLINDLLDMEKISAGKMHFDMQAQNLLPLLLQSIESNRAYGAERRVALDMDCKESDIEVRVDGHRLMQVMSNLLSNAIKFSPDDGQVAVSVASDGQRVTVSVSNRGLGIPDEFRNRIFSKFSQADSSDTRQKGGTGLGLAITKQLVEYMGGRIGFESEPGQGTRFHFELPLRHGASEASKSGNAERILVAEDEPDIAHLLRLMLEHAGYAVDTAYNGTEALAALERRHYAAMTLDLMLPDISGVDIIRRLRAQPKTLHLPIVVVSAKIEEGRLAINGHFSGIEWLAKPIDKNRLIDAIKHLTAEVGERRPRILHVEDDADLHTVIRTMAGDTFDFTLAASVADARRQIESEPYDLVFLDLALPDGSGWDLLPDIRARLPKARIVVLSGNDVGKHHARMVESVLMKSHISQQQLLDRLTQYIKARKDTQ